MYGKMTSSWAADGPPRLMEMGRMSANLAVGQVILQKRHGDSCPGTALAEGRGFQVEMPWSRRRERPRISGVAQLWRDDSDSRLSRARGSPSAVGRLSGAADLGGRGSPCSVGRPSDPIGPG